MTAGDDLVFCVEQFGDDPNAFAATFTEDHAHAMFEVDRVIQESEADDGFVSSAENRLFHVGDLGALADGETLDDGLIIDSDRRGMIQDDYLGFESPDSDRFGGRVHQGHAFVDCGALDFLERKAGALASGDVLDGLPPGVDALDRDGLEVAVAVGAQQHLAVVVDHPARYGARDDGADAGDKVGLIDQDLGGVVDQVDP